MSQKGITVESGKINDYLHHVDLREFGVSRILSCYIGEFDKSSVILDCGTSLLIKNVLKYLRMKKISLSTIKYLITTHHHFDHAGGMWKLYEEIKKHNPDVKIVTNQQTYELLNDYYSHLNRAKSTFGNSIGDMKSIEEKAFKFIEPIKNFGDKPSLFEIIDTFRVQDKKIKLSVIKTPGHTPDHQCPMFINNNNEIDFLFLGEAVGTMYHSSELLTLPTSMPVYFKYKEYMETLTNLKTLNPLIAGFGHFGVVNGKDNVREIILEHESFMKEYRAKIIKYYEEKPDTRYVVEKITPFLLPRTDLWNGKHPILNNVILAIVYGMMIDLGYRKIAE